VPLPNRNATFSEKLYLEKAARRRREGALPYSSPARERQAAQAIDTARLRRAYAGEQVSTIRRFKDLQRRKGGGEILSDEDFDFMMRFAVYHANQEYEFLHEDFLNSPRVHRSKRHFHRTRLQPRISIQTRVRHAAQGEPVPRRVRGR
jgi:hypothetical protein